MSTAPDLAVGRAQSASRPPRSSSEAVAGAEIHSERLGEGTPIVWFHHSFGNPGWGPAHDLLADDHAVVVPDLPGFGASTRLEWARDPRDLALVLGRWIDALGQGPIVGVGCGFGGWILTELALMAPARFSGLVLVGSAGLLPTQDRILDQMLVSHSQYVRSAFSTDDAYRDVFGTELGDELLLSWDLARETVARVAWKPYMYNRRIEPMLGELKMPALVVWGDQDRVIPRECGQRLASGMADAQFELVEDCGHAVDLEQPTVLADLVSSFLNSDRFRR